MAEISTGEMSVKWPKLELNKDDLKFLSKISENPLLGLIWDQIAFWRRKNAAKIIEKSRKFSEKHNVSLNKIPSKFLVEFMNDASLEEDEDLQMLWAKILSGESENPNSFSLKTLEILKVMNKNDAEIFLNLTHFLIIESNEVVFLLNNEKLLEQYKIKYSDLMKLEEYGLIVLDISLVLSLDISTEWEILSTKTQLLLLKNKNHNKMSLKAYALTTFGRQLFQIANDTVDDSFLYEAGKIIRKENRSIITTLHKIQQVNSDWTFTYDNTDLLPEIEEKVKPLQN